MLTEKNHRDSDISEYLTSSQAAKRLGLSMATIQKLVDNHILQGWKTFGGHRRISLASVLNYQNANNSSSVTLTNPHAGSKVMMVVESQELIQRLRQEVIHWPVHLKMSFSESMTEALLDLLNEKHDLLVLQMSSPIKQQEKALEILQKFMGSRNTLGHALILTTEDNLLPLVKLSTYPVSIQVLKNELTPDWFSAYWLGFSVVRPH